MPLFTFCDGSVGVRHQESIFSSQKDMHRKFSFVLIGMERYYSLDCICFQFILSFLLVVASRE